MIVSSKRPCFFWQAFQSLSISAFILIFHKIIPDQFEQKLHFETHNFRHFLIYLRTHHLGMVIPVGYYQLNPSYLPTQVSSQMPPQISPGPALAESKTKSQTKLYIQFRPEGSGDGRVETEKVYFKRTISQPYYYILFNNMRSHTMQHSLNCPKIN